MKFSDNLIRNSLREVYVKDSAKRFATRDEFGSNLWDIEKENIAFDKHLHSKIHLYKVPARAVRIGESIYDKTGKFEAYRSE